MIKPYYEEPNITIYHGDCLEIMPHLPKVDLVLTDPPYIFDEGGWGIKQHRKNYQKIANLNYGFDIQILKNFNNWMCFSQKRQLIDLLCLAND